MHLPLILITLWSFISLATAYRTDVDASGEEAFCEHRKHLTFKPTATCCANKVIKPGLELEKHWQECVPQDGSSDSVEGVGWDIYSCILKKASGGKDQLTLKEYADLITANYPDDIKSQINTEIDSQSIAATSIADYARMEKLRVTYYDIEKWVCEGMSGEKDFGKIEMCASWKEENHRAGMCCKKSYPVDIRFKSLFDGDSPNVKEQCREKMHDEMMKQNATEMIEDSLLEICDVACMMHLDSKYNFNMVSAVLNNRHYWNFNMTDQLKNFPLLIPSFLPATTREALMNNITLGSTYHINTTIENIKAFEVKDTIGGDSNTERPSHNFAWVHRGNKTAGENFKYEFMGRRFNREILHVPVICSAYKEVVSLMEYYVFSECKPEDVTEAPALPPPTEAPKSEPEPEAATSAPAAEGDAAATEAAPAA